MQIPERKILQFAIRLIQAQPVGNRCINLQRLRRNSTPFAARHVCQRAHIVCAICQLDQNHANIARHRQQHLAEGLGLVFLACIELKLVELGESIHEFGDRGTETIDQVGLSYAAIFHGIVQQRRHQCLGVELPGGAKCRHRNGVGDIGLTAVAQLTQVRLVGKAIGLPHQLDAGWVEVVKIVCQ